MAVTLSCAFATSLDTPAHIRVAEQLGYSRAWAYDSPALYPDVWVQLCRAADITDTIGLGPGVLVPSLRHPMTTAAAIATLVAAAGVDRVSVALGTGFTARMTMGQRSLKWREVSEYLAVLKALLRGEQATWDGGVLQMLHRPGFAPARPITIPFLLGVQGPKGIEAAQAADGVFGAPRPVPGFEWSVALTPGTVLDDGEDPGSERSLAAAGPAAAMTLHAALEYGRPDALPNGAAWAAAYDDVPAEQRHLALHDGHLTHVSERDRPFVTGELLAADGLALDAAAWRDRVAALADAGATEIAYQPSGPDIPRELAAFANAVNG